MLVGEVPDYKTATIEELREFVSANRPAFERVRQGLTKQCRLPAVYSPGHFPQSLDVSTANRKLARALTAAGWLAELENKPGDAAATYLKAIKMGARLSHGAVMWDALIATACEGEAENALELGMAVLDAEQLRKLIAELDKVGAELEPSDQILKHENMWARAQLRSIQGFKSYVGEVVDTRSLNPAYGAQQSFLRTYNARRQRELKLKARLAARAFELEKGRKPTGWPDLVPVYLQSVPLDPGTTNQLSFLSLTATNNAGEGLPILKWSP